MRPTVLTLACLTIIGLAGCGGERCGSCTADDAKTHAGHGKSDACAVPAALVATLQPTQGNQTKGTVRFTQVEGGVKIVADVEGLAPNGTHAIHIHEFGDMGTADGSGAGGHYNPGNHPHGGPDSEHHHAGDLGNLTADATGKVHHEMVAKGLSLCCGAQPIIGRSVIIHAKADDLTSQPAGNAGPRITQGVIGVAKAPAAP
jgi:Cu-Zn family superoxide dismutase